jgi:hypothetical protein
MWVALGKERTRNPIWILDDHKSSQFHHFSSVRTMAIQIIEVSFMMVMTIKFCVVIYLPWWWYVFLAQFQLLQDYYALTKI